VEVVGNFVSISYFITVRLYGYRNLRRQVTLAWLSSIVAAVSDRQTMHVPASFYDFPISGVFSDKDPW